MTNPDQTLESLSPSELKREENSPRNLKNLEESKSSEQTDKENINADNKMISTYEENIETEMGGTRPSEMRSRRGYNNSSSYRRDSSSSSSSSSSATSKEQWKRNKKKSKEEEMEVLNDITSWPTLGQAAKPESPKEKKELSETNNNPKDEVSETSEKEEAQDHKKKGVNWVVMKDIELPSHQSRRGERREGGQRERRGPPRNDRSGGPNWKSNNNNNRNSRPQGNFYRGVPLIPMIPIVALDGDLLLETLTKQIEYYFSTENLLRDIFFRTQMDMEGWVDLVLIANFNRVKVMTTDFNLILEAVKKSTILELKGESYVRLKDSWKDWPLSKNEQTEALLPKKEEPKEEVSSIKWPLEGKRSDLSLSPSPSTSSSGSSAEVTRRSEEKKPEKAPERPKKEEKKVPSSASFTTQKKIKAENFEKEKEKKEENEWKTAGKKRRNQRKGGREEGEGPSSPSPLSPSSSSPSTLSEEVSKGASQFKF